MSALLVTDLKQWVYCRRVVYYRIMMPGAGKPTYKMEEGRRAQELIESLEVRRTLARYGLENARRRFGVWLSDEELGLAGKIDLLVEGDGDGAVVDFKLTSGEPGENHRAQLAGYAVLAESALKLRIDRCFLVRIPDSRVFEIETREVDQVRVREMIREIQFMINAEVFPAATPVVGRCTECEYQNLCGDIW
jgi:CRISPR-associated exonuclease Cas4